MKPIFNLGIIIGLFILAAIFLIWGFEKAEENKPDKTILDGKILAERTESPSGARTDLDSLANQFAKGDTKARDQIIVIARSQKTSIQLRRAAIIVLANDQSFESLDTLYDLLTDPDLSIRSSALYALPKTRRPAEYDYTSEPNETTVKALNRERIQLLGKP